MKNVIEYTSPRGNRMHTCDVLRASANFIAPEAKPGQTYSESVLFAKAQGFQGRKGRKKAQRGGK